MWVWICPASKKITKIPEDQVEAMEQNDSGQSLDEKIKKLDYASLIFTLLYFIIFVAVYFIVAKAKSIWMDTK